MYHPPEAGLPAPNDPVVPADDDRQNKMLRLREIMGPIGWRTNGFEMHPAQYRLQGNPLMRIEMQMVEVQVAHCRGFYPDMPEDSVDAWIWVLDHPNGPEVCDFFKIRI